MHRIEFDVTTGEKRVIQLTQDEVAAIQAGIVAGTGYVPQEVTRFQARAALLQAGLLDDVESLVFAAGADRMLQLAYEAATFKRISQFVLTMAQQLGLSDEQLDELFIAASQID